MKTRSTSKISKNSTAAVSTRNKKGLKKCPPSTKTRATASPVTPSTSTLKYEEQITFNLKEVAQRYLSEAEEYVLKAERFEREAHHNMDLADSYSKKGEGFVEKALHQVGPDAVKLYEAARESYYSARKNLEQSVNCNDAATRNYRTARDYYEAYGRCCPHKAGGQF